MSKPSLLQRLLFGSAILSVLLAASTAVSIGSAARSDQPTNPPSNGCGADPTNAWCYNLTLYAQYYAVKKTGVPCGNGPGCTDLPLPATKIVETYKNKVLRTVRTNGRGFVVIHLPHKDGAKVELTLSHAPVRGVALGTRTFRLTAPVFQPDGTYASFTFCLGSC
jgi:hypothetical protein